MMQISLLFVDVPGLAVHLLSDIFFFIGGEFDRLLRNDCNP